MKLRRIIALSLLNLPLILFAQNWQPVNPGRISFYSNDDSGLMDHTVMVDSVSTLQGHEVFYMNTTIGSCDTCETPVPCFGNAGEMYVSGLPGIFAKDVHHLDNGIYWFRDTAQFVIHALAQTGQSWVYDTAANITAEVTETAYQELFQQVMDSLKVISLSNGQELMLSKNFGLIVFPAAPGDVESYTLCGFSDSSGKFGLTPPDFQEIFDVQVGDVFQYTGYEGNGSYPPPNSDFYTLKKEITAVSQTDSSVTISSDYIKRYTMSGTVHTGNDEMTYYDQPDFLPLQLPGTHYNICQDTQTYFELCSNDEQFYMEINHLFCPHLNQVKAIGNYQKGEYWDFPVVLLKCENQSPQLVDFGSGDVFSYGWAYAPGLGMVAKSEYVFEYFNDYDIEGYIKEADTVGVITPDEVLLDVNTPAREAAFELFPNPADGEFMVRADRPIGELSISTLDGKLVYAARVQANEIQIPTDQLKPGLYLVKMVNKDQTSMRKLMIR